MTPPLRLALIGLGKIAHDQHLPVLAGSPDFDVVATVSHAREGLPDTPHFRDIADLIASAIRIDAVAICTPPQVRRTIAQVAIAEGWHVLLEKPPCATLAEVIALRDAATATGVSLFASWHSRYAAGVAPARAWLETKAIRSASIVWREDARVWHPGQAWLWEPGGYGVFDPGINALSIITHILPHPLFVEVAELDVPANCATPIAARVRLRDAVGAELSMDLDFRQEGPQSWDIRVETDAGTLALAAGGAELTLPDGLVASGSPEHGEYSALYRHFAEIVRAGVSDVDLAPLRLVADTFLRGRQLSVEAFVE